MSGFSLARALGSNKLPFPPASKGHCEIIDVLLRVNYNQVSVDQVLNLKDKVRTCQKQNQFLGILLNWFLRTLPSKSFELVSAGGTYSSSNISGKKKQGGFPKFGGRMKCICSSFKFAS